jgi:hypothetical protein
MRCADRIVTELLVNVASASRSHRPIAAGDCITAHVSSRTPAQVRLMVASRVL